MNLTKRMLQFTTVCAGVCALSASATQYVGDSFENNDSDNFPATNGMGIVYYKATDNGFGTPSVTNWVTAEGDASTIIDADADNQAYASATRPMSGVVSSNLLLNLSTEGQTLSRTVNGGPITFTTTPVWVDTLIKFTASEDAPSSSDLVGAKAAVYVDAGSNLVVYHGVNDGDPTNTVIMAISTNDWHRLTINLGKHPETGYAAFKVWVDGTLKTSADAYEDNSEVTSANGYWFLSAVAANSQISSVAFKGTGKVDELVVTDEEVTFGPPSTGVLLTLSFNDDLMDVTQGGNSVASNGTVAVGSTITINAIDWYEIASVTGDGVVFTGPIGAQTNDTTGVLTMATPASTTVTITAQLYSGGTVATGPAAGYPADKVATWATNYSVTEGGLTAAMLDDYLCNVAPNTNPTLTISAISISGATATITVTASAGVELDSKANGGINGTLVVWTKDLLTDSWGEPTANFEVTAASGTSATITVNIASGNNFIRAIVK